MPFSSNVASVISISCGLSSANRMRWRGLIIAWARTGGHPDASPPITILVVSFGVGKQKPQIYRTSGRFRAWKKIRISSCRRRLVRGRAEHLVDQPVDGCDRERLGDGATGPELGRNIEVKRRI